MILESDAVKIFYPDPDPAALPYTPGLGQANARASSYEEMVGFLEQVATHNLHCTLETAGLSQEKRAIAVMTFSASKSDAATNSRPTVMIVGGQHGDEPAGSESALAMISQIHAMPAKEINTILSKLNLVIIPRANPDGIHHFDHLLKNKIDLNRDHLLGETPEGKALIAVRTRLLKNLIGVIDAHECAATGPRFEEKLGGILEPDITTAFANTQNIPLEVTQTAKEADEHMKQSLADNNMTHGPYLTTSHNLDDLAIAYSGGTTPETSRNVNGLVNANSVLIEGRGIGLGYEHLRRRVQGTLVAINAFVNYHLARPDELLAKKRKADKQVSENAGNDNFVIRAHPPISVANIRMRQRNTGNLLVRQFSVNDATAALETDLSRPRPHAYIVRKSNNVAAKILRDLGVEVAQVKEESLLDVETYQVLSKKIQVKKDVRGTKPGERAVEIIAYNTEIRATANVKVAAGDFYVSMAQPLGNIVGALIEPEGQHTLAANDLVKTEDILRVPAKPDALLLFETAKVL